jgi:alpha-D-xyloside xylohydrolase
MQELSGDKGVWGGLVPDFLDSKARAVFGGYHGKHLIDLGVDGFKLDECDNSDYTGGWSFPELSRFPSGADGEQMHSLFGMRYQQALWDARPTRWCDRAERWPRRRRLFCTAICMNIGSLCELW